VLPGGEQIDEVTINIQGLPVPSTARWYAVGLASAAVIIGLLLAASGSSKARDRNPDWIGDLHRARQRLLEQIAELEQARSRGDIGPKTYERSRRELLDALARVIALEKPDTVSARA